MKVFSLEDGNLGGIWRGIENRGIYCHSYPQMGSFLSSHVVDFQNGKLQETRTQDTSHTPHITEHSCSQQFVSLVVALSSPLHLN
jgi:hypothetical protein